MGVPGFAKGGMADAVSGQVARIAQYRGVKAQAGQAQGRGRWTVQPRGVRE